MATSKKDNTIKYGTNSWWYHKGIEDGKKHLIEGLVELLDLDNRIYKAIQKYTGENE